MYYIETYHICEELKHGLEHLKDSVEFLCQVGRQIRFVLDKALGVLGICSEDTMPGSDVPCLGSCVPERCQHLECPSVHWSWVARDEGFVVLHCYGSVEVGLWWEGERCILLAIHNHFSVSCIHCAEDHGTADAGK